MSFYIHNMLNSYNIITHHWYVVEIIFLRFLDSFTTQFDPYGSSKFTVQFKVWEPGSGAY